MKFWHIENVNEGRKIQVNFLYQLNCIYILKYLADDTGVDIGDCGGFLNPTHEKTLLFTKMFDYENPQPNVRL